jgi:hypothetical protein
MTSANIAAAPAGARWFFLVAEADPGLLPRVAGQFAKRSLVPAHLHLSERPDGLHLDIRVDGVDDATAHVLAGALRQIVGVRAALMTTA